MLGVRLFDRISLALHGMGGLALFAFALGILLVLVCMAENAAIRPVANHGDGRIEEVADDVEREVPMKAVADLVAVADPKAWALESYGLAVDSAYDGISLGESPSGEYEARWRETCEVRVALAGCRLAALLNGLAQEVRSQR